MTPLYPTMMVAAGRDPFDVISEVMLQRQPGSEEYIYHPGVSTPGRIVVGGPENLTPVNHEWLQQWHQENPQYSLRSPYHVTSHHPDSFSARPAIAMVSPDQVAANHHEISADVVHEPTHKKVGDFHFSLASWPELPKGKHIATAHIWSFYRHNKPEDGREDQHHGVMTNILDSWLGHAKKNGIRHGFIQGDASKGYWLKNITRHPNMVWGGVEYDAPMDRTRRASQMDPRRIDTLKRRPDLFTGWPGTRSNYGLKKAVGESVDENDAFMMRWNQEHLRPSHSGGPLPTHLMRHEKGRMKSYPGHLDKACYFHALRLAKKNPNMKLAIGFVVRKQDAEEYEKSGGPAPLLFTHAFNITKRGEVHDASLGSDRAVDNRYYGHVIEDPHQFKTSSDLYNWVGHHYQHGHFRGAGGVHMGIQTDIDHTRTK